MGRLREPIDQVQSGVVGSPVLVWCGVSRAMAVHGQWGHLALSWAGFLVAIARTPRHVLG